MNEEFKDVFLSHASEDKEKIVIPFSKELEKLNITYWLDLIELLPGDSLTNSIFKKGIGKCKYVVVFISKNFLKKGWATFELRHAMSKQIRENKTIVIPFLVDIDFEDLLSEFPEFENIFCGNLSKGFSYAARQIEKILLQNFVFNNNIFQKHEIINLLNKFSKETIEKLEKVKLEDLVFFNNEQYIELIYSFIFSNYSDEMITSFIETRISNYQLFPLETFFQISLLSNIENINSSSLIKRILSKYPQVEKRKFTSILLPNNKEVSLWTKIPRGEFIFGADKKDKFTKDWVSSPINVFLDDYEIMTVPVTNYHYELFYPKHKRYVFENKNVNTDFHPVVNVNWYESAIFALWLSIQFKNAKLPTEDQWEKAASWGLNGQKYRFPWGNEWIHENCNSWDGKPLNQTSQVGLFEKGKSQYGIYDMSGNVWEWCSDWFSDDWNSYLKQNTKNPTGPLIGNRKVDRGGGWYQDVGHPSVFIRAADYTIDRFPHCGFRLCK